MKAIAYINKNNEKNFNVQTQKNKIQEFARLMGVQIVAFYEETDKNKSTLNKALTSMDDFDFVLVNNVNCFGKNYNEAKKVVNALDKEGKAIIATNYYWDVLSQKIRRHYKAFEMKVMARAKSVKSAPKEVFVV